ncbi:helix-turn-helix domain-containing protein [Bradyrhizobium diazoefficiens]|nr:hypothetical protein XF16B_45290 [Bradyrhizobium diazoefficiens]BCF70182.1 hypothetical protein XF19B_45350 [Bradyrhizobium diazoefficiens]
MSLRALTWAFDCDVEELNTTLKFVLITLANYAGEDDETYPRQATIAKKTKLTRQTVNEALGRLQELGLIEMTRRTHNTGAFRSSIYRLMIPAEFGRVKFDDTADNDDGRVSNRPTRHVNDNDKGSRPDRQGMSASPTEVVGDDDNLNRILEPPPEPSQEPQRAPKRRRVPEFPADAFDQFWKLFPRKDGKGPARKKFQKIADEGLVAFETIMDGLRLYVNKDDFRDWCWPITWLNQERWEDTPVQKKDGVAKPKRRVAI